MKKSFVLFAIAGALLFPVNSIGAAETDIKIKLDGNLIDSPTSPILENGSIFVPASVIFRELGLAVDWDEETKTVTAFDENTVIQLNIGSDIAYLNNQSKKLNALVKIVNSYTMVPVRFISESIGHKVDWDENNRSVIISTSNSTNTGTGNDEQQNLNNTTNLNGLYAVDGVGEYLGYRALKGYPGEDKFQIYFEGTVDSMHATYEDLRGINHNEVVTWQYRGNTHRNTRTELYRLFSDGTRLGSILNADTSTFSTSWFVDTFGQAYLDWAENIAFANDAARLSQEFLQKESGVEKVDRYALANLDLSNVAYTIDGDWLPSNSYLFGDIFFDYTTVISPERKVVRAGSFYRQGLTSVVDVYVLWDMTESFAEAQNEEATFNGIRVKKIDGEFYFSMQDLISKNIIN